MAHVIMIEHRFILLNRSIPIKAFGDSNVMSGKIGRWDNAEAHKIKQLWAGQQQMSMYFLYNVILFRITCAKGKYRFRIRLIKLEKCSEMPLNFMKSM